MRHAFYYELPALHRNYDDISIFFNNTGYLACFLVSTDRIPSCDKFHVYITICICVMDDKISMSR